MAIGRDPTDLTIAVVNNEIPFNGSDYNCTINPGCDFTDLSCRLVHNINYLLLQLPKLKLVNFRVLDSIFEQNSLEPKYFADEAEAYRAVEKGEVWGRLILPANFSKNFLKRLWSSIDADVETLNKSSINVRKDYLKYC